MNITKRDKRIDILRSIALIGIIIAHAGPQSFIFQLRSFDVPLMVLLMGTSFYLSMQGKKLSYSQYIIKRIKRLLIPTWLYLTAFFIIFFFISLILNEPYYFNIRTIFLSYSLMAGIGYVWIMQVFLVIALINPMLLKFSKKIKSNIHYLTILSLIYIIYLLFIYLNNFLTGGAHDLYEHIVLYTIGYGLVAALGIRLKQLTNKDVKILIGIFLALLIILMFKNDFQLTNIAKYPPTMYYLSYALFISLSMYLLLDINSIFKLFNHNFIYFTSKNSLYIYLWHIVPVYIIKLFGDNLYIINMNLFNRFVFIYLTSIILTLIQNKISSTLSSNN